MEKLFLKMTACVLIFLLLTGCWDKIEIENRGYVITIGIDKYQNKAKTEKLSYFTGKSAEDLRYIISAALPNISELAEKGGGGEGRAKDGDSSPKAKSVKGAASDTVFGAMNLIGSYSNQKLYYGQTKLCVFGNEILKDKVLFKEAIDSLERNNEIGKKIVLLTTKDNAFDILTADVSGEPLVGIFVSNFYKNNKFGTDSTAKRDLQETADCLASSGNAVIPEISLENGEIKLSGLSVIKQYELSGRLDDSETRGYLWMQKQRITGVLTAYLENMPVPLFISNKRTAIFFKEENGGLVCYIRVKIDGSVEEYADGDLDTERIALLEKKYEETVRDEINKTADIFQKKLRVDGLGFLNTLRKDNYGLYLKYKDTWEDSFSEIVIVPVADVSVKSTGLVNTVSRLIHR